MIDSKINTMVEKRSAKMQPSNGDTNFLKDMSSSELTMIHRLSGNDPLLRKKTMRKLSKWLIALVRKVPDMPDSRVIIEPNLIRVWKALFYCMWMSDKPLVQEQLAEDISSLLKIFAPKPHILNIFVEWFILTIAREWCWIDRFRIDKYMMLVRRFLRRILVELSERKWKAQSLTTFLALITRHVFNRESLKEKRGSKTQICSFSPKTPVGFQIHFVDIFMEEFSKIGGDSLKEQIVLKVLTPFIHELSLNDDDRILSELKERIFHQLMKQSDVALDYNESKGGRYVFMEDENEKDDESGETMEEEPSHKIIMDPRAGAADVVLPQLQIDYDELSNKLIEIGGQNGIKMKNRKILYNLAHQFKEIVTGVFPLAIPRENTRKPAVPRHELKKATDRLLELEISDSTGQNRKTKRERRRASLRAESLNESLGSEDNSSFLKDDELLEHVSDNYMSYLEDEIQNKDESEEADTHNSPVKSPKSMTKKKKKRDTLSSDASLEKMDIDGVDTNVNGLPITNSNSETTFVIKRRKTRSSESNTNGDVLRTIKKSISLKAKKQSTKKSPRISSTTTPAESLLESLTSSASLQPPSTPVQKSAYSPVGSLKRRMRTPKDHLTPNANSSFDSTGKKKVCFVLAKNSEHEHADYKNSIERSPAIPYNAAKRPSYGLLKSPTPKSNIRISTPRSRASEFF